MNSIGPSFTEEGRATSTPIGQRVTWPRHQHPSREGRRATNRSAMERTRAVRVSVISARRPPLCVRRDASATCSPATVMPSALPPEMHSTIVHRSIRDYRRRRCARPSSPTSAVVAARFSHRCRKVEPSTPKRSRVDLCVRLAERLAWPCTPNVVLHLQGRRLRTGRPLTTVTATLSGARACWTADGQAVIGGATVRATSPRDRRVCLRVRPNSAVVWNRGGPAPAPRWTACREVIDGVRVTSHSGGLAFSLESSSTSRRPGEQPSQCNLTPRPARSVKATPPATTPSREMPSRDRTVSGP